MVNSMKQQKELELLRKEHEVIEANIISSIRKKVVNQFEVHDLKKKKLLIKESISRLEAILLGDIVA